MPRYELSLTKTEYLVTTAEATSPEEAEEECRKAHSPADVEIHAVHEVPEEPQNLIGSCEGCRYNYDPSRFLGCGHPENTGADADFWEQAVECFEEPPKIVSEGDTVYETGGHCASCGGDVLTNGQHVWCSKCAQLVAPETL